VQPIAIIASSAILVSLCIIFLSLGKGLLSSKSASASRLDPVEDEIEQPVVMTAAAILLIGVFVFSIFVGREILFVQKSAPAPDHSSVEVSKSAPTEELTELADSVDQTAEGLYRGLEKTKQFIGKTEVRKQAIEHGRDHANNRLESLSKRLRNAENQAEALRIYDREMAEHLTEGLH